MSAGSASTGLPGLKRYAGNEGEYAEIMRRHLTVLAGLLPKGSAGAERELMAVTISWSGDPGPVPRTAGLSRAMPAAACRASVLAGINAFSGAPDRPAARPGPNSQVLLPGAAAVAADARQAVPAR
jgi:hypothetical protein